MNVPHIPKATSTIRKGMSVARGLMLRRKRLTIAVMVAALLLPPLVLTASGAVFLFNALVLGGVGFMAWRLMRTRRKGKRRN